MDHAQAESGGDSGIHAGAEFPQDVPAQSGAASHVSHHRPLVEDLQEKPPEYISGRRNYSDQPPVQQRATFLRQIVPARLLKPNRLPPSVRASPEGLQSRSA